jgi:hypothetical protein
MDFLKKLKKRFMAKIFEHYREFDYQEDYERLAWEREKEISEQWELSEQKLNNHKKSTDYEFKKSNPLQSEDQIRA